MDLSQNNTPNKESSTLKNKTMTEEVKEAIKIIYEAIDANMDKEKNIEHKLEHIMIATFGHIIEPRKPEPASKLIEREEPMSLKEAIRQLKGAVEDLLINANNRSEKIDHYLISLKEGI